MCVCVNVHVYMCVCMCACVLCVRVHLCVCMYANNNNSTRRYPSPLWSRKRTSPLYSPAGGRSSTSLHQDIQVNYPHHRLDNPPLPSTPLLNIWKGYFYKNKTNQNKKPVFCIHTYGLHILWCKLIFKTFGPRCIFSCEDSFIWKRWVI